MPADDSLLFLYSFTGTEAVNLSPGMQVQVEHSIYAMRGGQRELQSVTGIYQVMPSGEGVAFRRVRTSNLHGAGDEAEILHLERMTAGWPKLHLYLQSVTAEDAAHGEVRRQPFLLAAKAAASMTAATEQIGAGGSGCSTITVPGVKCITFRSAVSLLLACRVNGHLKYYAPGTALSQLLEGKWLEITSLTMRRRRADGTYATVVFPATSVAASHIVLQNADEISWHRREL